MKKLLLSCLSLLCALPGFSQSDDTIIQFEDQNMKSFCVERWDTNSDGELSIGEAAAVTVFPFNDSSLSNITSFNDLQYFTGLTEIPGYAFNSYQMRSVILPENITSIGYSAFNNCSKLLYVKIPDKVTTIGGYAFANCSKLTTIILPSTLNSISDGAFSNCNIKTVVSKISNPFEIGESVFGVSSYYDYSTYKYVYVPCNATLYIPNNTISAYQAIKGWTMFKEILEEDPGDLKEAIVDNLKYAYWTGTKRAALIGYENLNTNDLIIPQTIQIDGVDYSVTAIGDNALNSAPIKSVTVPEGVETIADYAFKSCNLKTLELPSTLTEIGTLANSGTPTYIYSHIEDPSSVTISYNTFSYCYNTTLYVPEGSIDKYKAIDTWNNSFKAIVEGEPPVEAKINGFWYNLFKDNTAEIIKDPSGEWQTEYSFNGHIPSQVEYGGKSYAVIRIADYAFSNAYFTNASAITIPESVTTIGVSAFSYTYITGITIGKGVTSIGANAFFDCSYLETIEVNAANTVFDSRDNCNAIIAKESDELLFGCKNTIIPDGVKSIGEYAFYGCDFSSISIPSSVTIIKEHAFYNSRLTKLVLPEGVKEIRGYAFAMCSSLKSVKLPSTVNSIGNYAFSYDNNLVSVTSHIANPFPIYNVFEEAYSGTLYVPEGKISAYQSTEGWSQFTNIEEMVVYEEAQVDGLKYSCVPKLGEATVIAGDYEGLTDVTVPASITVGGKQYAVTAIADNAFESTDIKTISLPTSLKTIGSGAFKSTKLTSVSIPEGVETLGDNAFQFCSLISLELPSTLKSIGIIGCYSSNLKYVVSHIQEPFNIGYYTFTEYDTPLDATLYVPYYTTSQYQNCSGWASRFASIEEGEPAETAQINGLWYSLKLASQKATVIRDPNTSTDAAYYWEEINSDFDGAIPSQITYNEQVYNVTEIGAYAFAKTNFTNSATITIPESVTTIGVDAFWKSNLNGIVIGKNVTTIAGFIFDECTTLTSIKVDAANTTFDSRNNCNAIIAKANDELLYGCKNTVIPNGVKIIGESAFAFLSSLTSITIPSTVKIIKSDAFYGSGLTSITIPESVEQIEGWAFGSCTSLKSAKLPSSLREISAATFNSSGLNTITIPEGITTIYDGAFSNCTSLRRVDLPSTLTQISNGAFTGNENLKIVVSHIQNPFDIDESVFGTSTGTYYSGTSAKLYVPVGTKSQYEACSGWDKLYGGIEEGDPGTELEVNGVWYLLNTSTLTAEVIKNPSKNQWDDVTFSSEITIRDKVTYDDKSYTVTSIGDYAFSYTTFKKGNTEITIPATITTIGTDAFSSANITGVVIGKGVETIGDRAFNYCYDLASITVDAENAIFDSRNNCNAIIRTADNALVRGCNTTVIPEGVVSILEDAFSGSYDLTDLIIPASVSSISEYAAFTYRLESIVVDGNNQTYDSRDNCNAIIEKATNTLILGCDNTIIPNSVKKIGNNAFNCHFTSFVIPEGVEAIGDYAFSSCYYLEKVELPSTLKSIGYGAFNGIRNLKTVTSHIEEPFEISEDVFGKENWSSYPTTYDPCSATLYVPAGKVEAYQQFAGWTMFADILEEGAAGNIQEIDGIWYRFISLTNTAEIIRNPNVGEYDWVDIDDEIIIPAEIEHAGKTYTVTSIADKAFVRTSLCATRALAIPESVTTIGEEAFGQSNLEAIYIGKGVSEIGNSAFRLCTNLTNITVDPENQTFDSRNDCNALIRTQNNALIAGCSNTVIPEGIQSIEGWAFDDCINLQSITIPYTVTYISPYAFLGCYNLTDITVSPYNSTYDSRNNCNALIETATNSLILGCKNTVIPNTVKSIGYDAFEGCYELKSITIPESVEYIGGQAFSGTGLTSLVLPQGLQKIGGYAFAYCSDLKTVDIPASVTDIDNGAFYRTQSLEKVTSRIKNPFAIDKDVFAADGTWNEDTGESTYSPSNATLYVPLETMTMYEQHEGWRTMFADIVEKDLSAVTIGDANGDDNITVTDAVIIIRYILGENPANFNADAADVNRDGIVTVADATQVVKMVVGQ